jgi:hypothetical protein
MVGVWIAVYLPDMAESVVNCESREDAEAEIVRRNCSMCEGEGIDSACAAEWLVMPHEAFEGADDVGGLFEAAGMERVG